MRGKKNADRFVKLPLWWAEQAAQATQTPKAMVWVWLLYLAWRDRSKTFRLSNARLKTLGVSPHSKRRTLQQLEAAGLIQVSREHGKSPTVTLLYN